MFQQDPEESGRSHHPLFPTYSTSSVLRCCAMSATTFSQNLKSHFFLTNRYNSELPHPGPHPIRINSLKNRQKIRRHAMRDSPIFTLSQNGYGATQNLISAVQRTDHPPTHPDPPQTNTKSRQHPKGFPGGPPPQY